MKVKSLVIAAIGAMAVLALAMICVTHLSWPASVPLPGSDQTHTETGQERPEVAAAQHEVAAERMEVETGSAGSSSGPDSS